MQKALSSRYDTGEPHRSLANFHEILTNALFEKCKLIRRSTMSRLAWLCEAQKSQNHHVTISTFDEVLLRNHASPSWPLTGRNPKNGGLPFPSSSTPCKTIFSRICKTIGKMT